MFSLKSRLRKLIPQTRSGKPYILPTIYGIGFLFLIVDIFALGYYRDNAPYHTVGLTLIVFGLVAMIHTNTNIQNVRVLVDKCEPMASGDGSQLRFSVRCLGSAPSHNLWVELGKGSAFAFERASLPEVAMGKDETGSLTLRCERRGIYRIDRIKVLSRGVYGLFQAWSWHEANVELIVYPKPRGSSPLPPRSDAETKTLESLSSSRAVRGEDFQGHRPYTEGEALWHVDWKAYARGQEMLIKDYAGEGAEALDLHWDDTRGSTEERLEQLSAWIVGMVRAQRPFSLHLPNFDLPRGSGTRHEEKAYYALAAFEEP
jgi:uncharacterized protein (DUF58 family)